MSSTNLWPSFSNIAVTKTPKIILQEQGVFLEKACTPFLITEIITTPHNHNINNNKVSHALKITAPLVENYTAIVIVVEHDPIKIYPTTVASRIRLMPVAYNASNEEELVALLKKIFEEKETVETIQSLLSQGKAAQMFGK
ncbi:hypothetical protein [Parasediminibacterium sp. JCM 36343]|uniref:hypothetical protein n=1 Tax=Parasediminibacterium sp. JCM 36343 TaxID=3374279 RepID=UPI00397DA6B2